MPMDDTKEILLSAEGLRQVREELEFLKTTRRREVAERLKEARDLGDLSENSEYDDARNEQAFVEGRIAQLEKTVRNARVIIDTEVESQIGLVRMGSTVVLRDLEFDETLEYILVGSVEADPAAHKISNESPVGQSILGKHKGDIVSVEAPAGPIRYEIVDVK